MLAILPKTRQGLCLVGETRDVPVPPRGWTCRYGAAMRAFFRFFFSLLFLGCAHALAGEVYKSVDAAGNVTYSTTPPADAVEVQAVDLPPGPSEQQVQEAVERAGQTRQAADKMTEQRRQKEQAYRERREQAGQENVQSQAPADTSGDSYYGAGWGYPYYPRPIRPHPPKPRPPIEPPPPPVVKGGAITLPPGVSRGEAEGRVP